MIVRIATRGSDQTGPKEFELDVSVEDLNNAISTHNNDPRRHFLWFNSEKTDLALIIPVHDLLWIKPAEKTSDGSES